MAAFDAVTVTLVETVVGKNKFAVRILIIPLLFYLKNSHHPLYSSFCCLRLKNCHHHDHPMLFHVVGLFAFEKLSDECIDLS